MGLAGGDTGYLFQITFLIYILHGNNGQGDSRSRGGGVMGSGRGEHEVHFGHVIMFRVAPQCLRGDMWLIYTEAVTIGIRQNKETN